MGCLPEQSRNRAEPWFPPRHVTLTVRPPGSAWYVPGALLRHRTGGSGPWPGPPSLVLDARLPPTFGKGIAMEEDFKLPFDGLALPVLRYTSAGSQSRRRRNQAHRRSRQRCVMAEIE